MSKKQQAELEADADRDVLLSVPLENVKLDPEVVAVVASGTSEPTHWIQNLWNGQPHWECVYCPFDTLDAKEVMAQHYRAQHAPPPPPAPISVVLVADRFGNVMR